MLIFFRFVLSLLCLLLASSAQAQSGRTLTLPAQVSGALTDASEQVELTRVDAIRPADRYTFTLPSGQTATVRMESEAFDTYLKVLRNGQVSDRNDDYQGSRAVSQVTLSRPGVYTVLAGGFSEMTNTGPYTLSVTTTGTAELSKKLPPAYALTIPGRTKGRLTATTQQVELTMSNDLRPADRYTFTLEEGQDAVVRMESTNFDTYLKVLHDGEYYTRNDDLEGSRDVSQVNLYLPGEYTVFAGTFSAEPTTGAYELVVSLTSRPSTSAPPRDGSTTNGTLTDEDRDFAIILSGAERKADAYAVDLSAGEVLTVQMESNVFDTYLAVSIDGQIVARNDDDGSTQRSQIRYIVPRDGEYYIFAGTFSDTGRGDYTFTWDVR